jgi:hypothetical protein
VSGRIGRIGLIGREAVELKLPEAIRTGSEKSYESFVAWCDRAIAEALAGHTRRRSGRMP